MATSHQTRLANGSHEALPEQILAALEHNGYCIVEKLISPEHTAKIKSELTPFLQKQKMGRNDFEGLNSERVYALLSKAPSIATLVEHPIILSVVDQVLEKNYLLSAALAINVHPEETPQNFHRDDNAMGNLLQMPRPMTGISAIWAIDEFNESNGSTEVIPGSHLWHHSQQPNERDTVKAIMPAGSVLILAGNLFHRGGANVGRTTRLGVTPQYCQPWLRQLENMTLAVPPKQAGQYSQCIQELLGYNVIDPGFMGYVDGMHPKKLINPAYRGRKYRDELPPS